jgi:hypothetical protein
MHALHRNYGILITRTTLCITSAIHNSIPVQAQLLIPDAVDYVSTALTTMINWCPDECTSLCSRETAPPTIAPQSQDDIPIAAPQDQCSRKWEQ